MKKANQKEAIKAAIIANPTIDRAELAEKQKVSLREVGAMYASLRRYGIITAVEAIKEPKKLGRKPKDDKNTYKNETGANKAIAREKMANIIIKSGVSGIIPTLPNTNWAIELMINKAINSNSFLGVERNPITYKKMRSKLKELKKSDNLFGATHLGNISEVIYGKNEGSYAHMILDYCGNLVTIKKELEYSIQNNVLAVGGVMAITFAKPIRGTDAESLKLLDLAVENNTDNRCASDKAIEAYFQKITGFTHKVVEFFYYQDTYPMTLVLIKRTK
jgi:DNA-binding Lrp family transcriptional regulator